MGTVVGTWRLKIILVLFLYVFLTYSAYGVFGEIETAEEWNDDLETYGGAENEAIANNSLAGEDIGTGLKDWIFGLGSFLTFGEVGNSWARLILSTSISICLITIGYIILTFIKEWIPFV